MLDAASANPPESIFGDFDLVFCRNLLMYYRREQRISILKKLEESLSETGFLIVGEVEGAFVKKYTDLRTLPVPSAVFQRPERPRKTAPDGRR